MPLQGFKTSIQGCDHTLKISMSNHTTWTAEKCPSKSKIKKNNNKCCFKGIEPQFRGTITLLKYLCQTIAPEQLIRAQSNLILKKQK